MTDTWYETAEASARLTQGDIIFDCPIVSWGSEPLELERTDEIEILTGATHIIQANVIVMTQACDLEYEKVRNVVLCPLFTLNDYQSVWQEEMRRKNQNPTTRAWRRHCEDICDGFVWNLSILNAGNSGNLTTEHLIVDFAEVYTVPRDFLESFLTKRGQPRLRLSPPYREHLSQSFARFFMRVGLPVPVTPSW